MANYQPGILLPPPKMARYLAFAVLDPDMIVTSLKDLAQVCDGEDLVVGIGRSLISLVNGKVPALRDFPVMTGKGIEIPSTPTALWCWLRGQDRGELFHRSMELESVLSPGLGLNNIVDAFQYRDSRDLTGFEDGTENPQGDDALAAALLHDQGPGLDGSSFVAVQQWLHDFDYIQALEQDELDNIIGRHQDNNEEFEEAPDSAHVKIAAQESYEPAAFILRRSMPWVEGSDGGLLFTAFGKSFDAFESILKRMIGSEDKLSDALFSISRPISGAYYWCPPMKDGRLDLSRLAL